MKSVKLQKKFTGSYPGESEREDRLLKNTMMIGAGSICSRLLQFLLIPFYTRILSTEDYGNGDLLQAMVQLLFPLMTLSIYEAVFRFTMERDCDREQVLEIGLLLTGMGSCLLLISCTALDFIISAALEKSWLTAWKSGSAESWLTAWNAESWFAAWKQLSILSRFALWKSGSAESWLMEWKSGSAESWLMAWKSGSAERWLTVWNTIAVAFWTLLSQYTRATGKITWYAQNNILLNGAAAVLNFLFLAVFRMGLTGYMLGYILANLIASLDLLRRPEIRIRQVPGPFQKQISRPLLRKMICYALPLALNGVCWWVSAFTDRVMIRVLLGASAAGLYAAASKIPHLLSQTAMIFCHAWEISANEASSEKDSREFYTEIFRNLIGPVLLAASLLMAFSRKISLLLLGGEYSYAWTVIPPLTLAAMFFSFSAFLQSIYAAKKNTRMIFTGNLVCLFSNIILNPPMIQRWGITGAAAATAISYALLWLLRAVHLEKSGWIWCSWGRMILSASFLMIQSIAICHLENTVIIFIMNTIGVISLFCWHKASFVKPGRRIIQKVMSGRKR